MLGLRLVLVLWLVSVLGLHGTEGECVSGTVGWLVLVLGFSVRV